MVATVALGAALTTTPGRAAALAPGGVSVVPSAAPAYTDDAPDPDVVRVPSGDAGTQYYAFTTGTTVAGYLQALCASGAGAPDAGWAPCPGTDDGASALPRPPSWQQLATQNAPGVYRWAGTWIMFYTAARAGHRGNTGANCLSVATSTDLSPQHPAFTDTSAGPLLCDAALGGAIDPIPFVDPADGRPYLVWKSNDGGSAQPARLWSQPLGPDGRTLVGQPRLLQVQDTVHHPFETTIENPQLVSSGGGYVLLFSTGIWNSSSYGETAVRCDGPAGPCDEPVGGPFLTSGGDAQGRGGGMLFTDDAGSWHLAYGA